MGWGACSILACLARLSQSGKMVVATVVLVVAKITKGYNLTSTSSILFQAVTNDLGWKLYLPQSKALSSIYALSSITQNLEAMQERTSMRNSYLPMYSEMANTVKSSHCNLATIIISGCENRWSESRTSFEPGR
jgi:hypothetical protein